MSTTAFHYRRIKDLEKTCEHQGFALKISNVFGGEGTLALVPGDGDQLPIYTRDADLYRGTAEELQGFLMGWYKAKEYFSMLQLIDEKKIARKEQDYRNKNLARLIKNGKTKDEI